MTEEEPRLEMPKLLNLTLVDIDDQSYHVTLGSSDVPVELRSTLADYLPTSHHTNYAFKCNGEKLGDFTSFEE
jgi:hypothetical protein